MGKTKLVGALAFGLASIMNPAFFTGCGSVLGPKFSFSEAEVVALVDVAKAQRYELRTSDGTYEVIVDISQARGDDSKSSALEPVVRPAHACGNRTFMRSAAACLDETDVPVSGTITVKRIAPDAITLVDGADAKGELSVTGTTLDNAEIQVESAGENRVSLRSNDAKTFKVHQIVIAGKLLEPARNGG